MGLINLISKLTGVEKKVKWSRAKRITVVGPEFWGQYDVFVDQNFDVAFFMSKADATLHVFVGNPVEATQWLKYEPNGSVSLNDELERGALEWKINPKNVLFRGSMLPPGRTVYRGDVVGSELFQELVTPDWIDQHAKGIVRSIVDKRGLQTTESTVSVIRRFEEQIRIQRDQLFGISLFSQGLEVIYSGQSEVLEMNRQSSQNITERAESAISAAESLLRQAKADLSSPRQLMCFRFPPISGNPMLDQMTQRAQILVRTYEQMFPDRPRSEPLSREEIRELMAAAADQL